jgi:hypothetical protein
VQTFPSDFYEHLFRLRGLEFPRDTPKRPQYFGHLTNDIVYRRLAPGVLDELQKVTPKLPSGRRKHHYFRRLTDEVGHPKLREHMASVIILFRSLIVFAPVMARQCRCRSTCPRRGCEFPRCGLRRAP